MSHEQRLAGQRSLTGRLHLSPHALIGFGTVAHLRLEGYAVAEVHHGATLGDDSLPRIQFDFDELQIVAMDGVADIVTLQWMLLCSDWLHATKTGWPIYSLAS